MSVECENFLFPRCWGQGVNTVEYWVICHTRVFLPHPLPCLCLGLRMPMTPASSDRCILVPASAHDDDAGALVMPLLSLSLQLLAAFCFFQFLLCLTLIFNFLLYLFIITKTHKFQKVLNNIQGMYILPLISIPRDSTVNSFFFCISSRQLPSKSYNLKLMTALWRR